MVTFFRYQYVRLDGTMSIKKRQKIVDRFNDPHVSSIRLILFCETKRNEIGSDEIKQKE